MLLIQDRRAIAASCSQAETEPASSSVAPVATVAVTPAAMVGVPEVMLN